MSYFLPFRLWLNKFKIPAVVFSGIGYLPYPSASLVTVIGKPLALPRIENPTERDIEMYHEKYLIALKDLFDQHVMRYNDPLSETKLEIF